VNIAPVPQVRECDGFQKVDSAERADDVFAHNFPRRAGIDRIRDIQPIRGRGSSRILPRRKSGIWANSSPFAGDLPGYRAGCPNGKTRGDPSLSILTRS
jgi:hypothetical protein